MRIDTKHLRSAAECERGNYDTGQSDFTSDMIQMCDELDRLYALEQELIALKKKIKADKAPPKREFCGKFSSDLYACDSDEGPDACPSCRKKYIEECKNEQA